MPLKPPAPYSAEYAKLGFGNFEHDCEGHTSGGMASLTGGNYLNFLALQARHGLQCHEVRLLFGLHKVRYEMSISYGESNRGRIEIDFSSIAGMTFDDAASKVTVQLSKPPAVYVGEQVMMMQGGFRMEKSATTYEAEQTDFSNGDIKSQKTHWFTMKATKYKAFKKKVLLSPDFVSAVVTGVAADALSAQFSREEIEASMAKIRMTKEVKAIKAAVAAGKKRAANENDPEGGNGASSSRGAAAAKKKASPKMLPGLLRAAPADAGPWLQRCIARWRLTAPFDPSVTESQWEDYYKERAALDWWTEANGCKEPKSDGGAGASDDASADKEPEWKEDFDKPSMGTYPDCESWGSTDTVKEHVALLRGAMKVLAAGCPPLLQDDNDFPDKLASGCYVLSGHSNWEDEDTPRSFDLRTRLYSPCGLGTSVDLSMKWHLRHRMSFAEHFASVEMATRTAARCRPSAPRATACVPHLIAAERGPDLFSMEEQDSGYMKRSLVQVGKLHSAQEALFGRKNLLSDRKMFALLARAVTNCDVPEVRSDLKDMFRVSRRKWKAFEGETGDASDGDVESYNESLKKKKPRRGGGGYGAFDDYGELEGGFGHRRKKGDCSIM